MTKRRANRFGLTGPGAWILAAVVSLGAVRSAAAEDAAKAEAQRLAAELNKAKALLAVLEAENKSLRAELKDEQLKNAREVDQEVKQLRAQLRELPERAELQKELHNEKLSGRTLRVEFIQRAAELEKEKGRGVENAAAAARKAQAEIDRLSDDLLKKTAETRTHEERLASLIEQVAAVKLELAALQSKKPDEPLPSPKIDPKPADDGPTADQLKRLADKLRPQADAARREAEQALQAAEEARLEAEKARLQAELREKAARDAVVNPNVDAARLEAEVRAAKFEAQLHVMQMAYDDLRRDASRLRTELDAERKARFEQGARGGAADPVTQQRLANLETAVMKISMAIDVLLKKPESPRPEK